MSIFKCDVDFPMCTLFLSNHIRTYLRSKFANLFLHKVKIFLCLTNETFSARCFHFDNFNVLLECVNFNLHRVNCTFGTLFSCCRVSIIRRHSFHNVWNLLRYYFKTSQRILKFLKLTIKGI